MSDYDPNPDGCIGTGTVMNEPPGSVSQDYGSSDADSKEIFTDPQNCSKDPNFSLLCGSEFSLLCGSRFSL
jgi:hypothetical protein